MFRLQSRLIRALSNSRRLEIIQLLRDQEVNVTKMQQMLGLPQANLSQHLMILRSQKIVTQRKNGKEVYYRLSDKRFLKICDWLREILIDHNKNTSMADELTLKMKDLIPVVNDPVCGMRVSPKTASFAYEYKGQAYYFCASGCLKTFKKNPNAYAAGGESR